MRPATLAGPDLYRGQKRPAARRLGAGSFPAHEGVGLAGIPLDHQQNTGARQGIERTYPVAATELSHDEKEAEPRRAAYLRLGKVQLGLFFGWDGAEQPGLVITAGQVDVHRSPIVTAGPDRDVSVLQRNVVGTAAQRGGSKQEAERVRGRHGPAGTYWFGAESLGKKPPISNPGSPAHRR